MLGVTSVLMAVHDPMGAVGGLGAYRGGQVGRATGQEPTTRDGFDSSSCPSLALAGCLAWPRDTLVQACAFPVTGSCQGLPEFPTCTCPETCKGRSRVATFAGTRVGKYQMYSGFVNSLEDLTPRPAIAGELSKNSKETRPVLPGHSASVRPETGPGQA